MDPEEFDSSPKPTGGLRKSRLTFQAGPSIDLCMIGSIRTKEVCPRCGRRFTGEPLKCAKCQTTPRRYFVDFYWKKQIKLYSDQDGFPLSSWEQAHRLLSSIRYQIDRSRKSKGKITFDPKDYVKGDLKAFQCENYFQAWLERRQKEVDRDHLSRGYLRSVNSYLKIHLIPFFGELNIRELSEGNIEDFRDQLPTHLSPKMVANIIGVLRKILRDAYRRKDIERVPFFPKIEVGDPKTRYLEEEEQYLILDQITDPVRRAFFLFMFKQATRPGEARALRWENIDFKRNRVTIAAAMDLNVYKNHTKERDIRELPLHEDVRAALESLPRNITGFVFTFRGKPFSHKVIYDTWRRACQKAGIGINLYQGTRHSLPSQAINAGVDPKIIQKMLGHKDPRSTARYTHLLTNTLRGIWKRDYPQTIPDPSHPMGMVLKIKEK